MGKFRTGMYEMIRVCERFHKWPTEFDELDFDTKRHLIAYERIRQQEDIPDDLG